MSKSGTDPASEWVHLRPARHRLAQRTYRTLVQRQRFEPGGEVA
jgi:hypothetical protein